MAEVLIYAGRPRSLELKRQLVREITDTLVRVFKASPEHVVISIIEAPLENKAIGGVLFCDRPPLNTLS